MGHELLSQCLEGGGLSIFSHTFEGANNFFTKNYPYFERFCTTNCCFYMDSYQIGFLTDNDCVKCWGVRVINFYHMKLRVVILPIISQRFEGGY